MADNGSTEPHAHLVARDALRGVTVGISVSDSTDLSQLGLTPRHCDLAVAELARAVFLAGGAVVYGGRLHPSGFTDILIDEVRRYREDRDALVLCVPASEHHQFTNDELVRRQQQLHSSAELILLDEHGEPIAVADHPTGAQPDVAASLTGMREHVTRRCDARVLVGGRLHGTQGAVPGIIEEATLSAEAGQPLYVAAGFGGAAAAAAKALDVVDTGWYPDGFPDGANDHQVALARLRAAANKTASNADGLSDEERNRLGATHRPGDIASLVVTGLGRWASAI